MKSIPAGIQKLHQQDIDATVSRDLGKLTGLWAEDAVLLNQGDEPLVGKAAIEASLKQNFAANPTMKVLKYVPEIADSRWRGMRPMSGVFSTQRTNSRRIASRRVFAPGFCA